MSVCISVFVLCVGLSYDTHPCSLQCLPMRGHITNYFNMTLTDQSIKGSFQLLGKSPFLTCPLTSVVRAYVCICVCGQFC